MSECYRNAEQFAPVNRVRNALPPYLGPCSIQGQAGLAARPAPLSALGELTASIVHEVNQPLAAIVTHGEACLRWLDRDVPQLDEIRSTVTHIIADGNRASEVIRHLRALFANANPRRVQLNLNDVLDESIALVQRELLSRRASLRRELDPTLPPVLADRVQLQQVVVNLLVNGLQAMDAVVEGSRELLIRSARHEVDQVLVTVQDSGPGIAPEHVNRLFEAFFTTKRDGMGMGLSICRSIIQAHGGRVWAARPAGRGAAFHFALPAIPENP